MTTVVYRDGIMCSDTKAYAGSILNIGQKKKIWRLPGGILFGVTSRTPGLSEYLADWYMNGHDVTNGLPEGNHSFNCLAVHADGRAYINNDSLLLSGPLTAPFWAIGSGAEYAMGALAMGASARQACEVAATMDPWTEPPFLSLTHDGEPCPLS